MKNILQIAFYLCCFIAAFGAAEAQNLLPVDRQNVTVCPAFETDTAPPSFEREGCEQVTALEVDPQSQHIWVILEAPLDRIPETHPMGLFVFAKASSVAYLNGTEIGRNGAPADSKANEIPGRMDYVFPLPTQLMQIGQNQIAIRMSSHSGRLDLLAPIHAVFIKRHIYPQNGTLRAYWPSLLPFGAFVLAALYFLAAVALDRERLSSALLAGMSFLAAVQLLVEVSRGLTAYAYPFHDVRLLLIAACSAGFGLTLAAYVISRFRPGQWRVLFALAAISTTAMLMIPTGFDNKTSLALLAPTLVSAGVALSALKTEGWRAGLFVGALALFALINYFGAGRFLDQYFYYVVALLLGFLFIQQAGLLARAERLRRQEESRAEKLQYVLDQLNEDELTLDLPVRSAGRIVRLNSNEIAFISAAGDYAEVTMKNGDTHLQHSTLADLEATLPSYFLRVHRSHLVNSKMIVELERNTSGTGELRLTTDHTVPVSRRIMPRIRAALS
jgi:DNA-binding LytR/AlgR family response regulator